MSESFREKLVHYQTHPQDFIEEVMGINEENGFSMSNQQREAAVQLGRFVEAKFAVHDGVATEEEKELASHLGLSIRAGKGVGKDAMAAWLVHWFLCCFPRPKIPCLGPNSHQINTVLWAEITKWHSMRNKYGEFIFHDDFRENIVIDSRKVYWAGPEVKTPGKEWFAIPKTVQKSAKESDMANALGGIHEDYMLAVFDEAAGIHNIVFESIENTLTGFMNIPFLIFNPNTTSGFAYDTHFDAKVSKQWIKIHWSGEESSNVTEGYLEKMRFKYGKDSDNYRVYVLGEPPRGEDDALIPFEWVQKAIDKDIPCKEYPVFLGVDVARSGGDSTVICVRQGPKVHEFVRVDKIESIEVAQEVLKVASKWRAESIFIDSIGVGAGVFDQLRRWFPQTYGVEAGKSAINDEKFRRLRDELWWKSRQRFEQGLVSIPDNKDLSEQLSSTKYETLMNGKIAIENKDDMRKRLGGDSPDYADALNLTWYMEDLLGAPDVGRYVPTDEDRYDRMFEKHDLEMRMAQNSWMTC